MTYFFFDKKPIFSFLLAFLFLNCTQKSGDSMTMKQTPTISVIKDSTVSAIKNKTQENPCYAFDALNTEIRDGKISQKEAQTAIKHLLPQIDNYYYENGGENFATSQWAFPLKNYEISAVGGTNGNGYIAKGYNYFDGNKHTGHPAQDIFIRDKNQDCLEDTKQEYVSVLSVSGGIVVALETEWDTASSLRGGIYVWIYDPHTKSMLYYAHNSTLLVTIGEIVHPGQEIAKVGRTGLNAYKKRSPTHLHITWLEVSKEGIPTSKNLYSLWRK